MASYILDTNIISRILAKNPEVERHLEEVVAGNATIVLCPVVFYEIRRGLLKRDAARKLEGFQILAQHFRWDEIGREDWHTAAELWAESERQGAPRDDADILIASHALRLGAILVTDNEDHFRHIGVPTENWCRA